jgi:hypothetical protein
MRFAVHADHKKHEEARRSGGLLQVRDLVPVDVVSVVHAMSGRKLRSAPVVIAITVTIEIAVVVAPRLTGCPVFVPVAVDVMATCTVAVHVAAAATVPVTAKIIAVASRLADRAMLLHLVAGAEAGCSRPAIVSIATTPHFVTGASLRSPGTAPSVSPLRMCERHRAQQQHTCNSCLPYHQEISSSCE